MKRLFILMLFLAALLLATGSIGRWGQSEISGGFSIGETLKVDIITSYCSTAVTINGTKIKSNGSILMAPNDTLTSYYTYIKDVSNTASTAALCSLYRADTNNGANNRMGLKIIYDTTNASPLNTKVKGLYIGGNAYNDGNDNYIATQNSACYWDGNGTFSTINLLTNSMALNHAGVFNFNNNFSVNTVFKWSANKKGKLQIQSGKNVSANADSLFELLDSLGNTRFRVNNRGQITVLDTIKSDLVVNGLIKSGTFIVNFFDKDNLQYLYIPRNASSNYEKSPLSIAEPDSIIIDSVSFMAYYPPGTGADSNQIDSIWIKCDWSLVGEGSGGTVWSYGTDLIQSGSGFHKNTGLIKTSGTGKFHPTDRFIIYITGKKNENNTVEMTNLSAYCRYK